MTAETYSVTDGTELTYAANGLVNTPDDTAENATAYTAGNTIVAKWYQPIEADTYTGAFRVSGTMYVMSYAINGIDGTATTACGTTPFLAAGA
jgi:hypothetical protein